MDRRRRVDVPDMAVNYDNSGRPDDARQDAQGDFLDQRSLHVQEMVEPAVRIILDHGNLIVRVAVIPARKLSMRTYAPRRCRARLNGLLEHRRGI